MYTYSFAYIFAHTLFNQLISYKYSPARSPHNQFIPQTISDFKEQRTNLSLAVGLINPFKDVDVVKLKKKYLIN